MLDLNVHLGDLMVTSMVAGATWVLGKVYKAIDAVIRQHDQALHDLDDHAEVINTHTKIFVDAGMVQGSIGIPRVEERRRKGRIISEPL
jgi:hypothetical protein